MLIFVFFFYCFALDYILIFPSLTFSSLKTFCFCVCVCYVGILLMSVSLPPNKLADIQQLALSLL